jgi:hypothetical protein
MKQHFLILFVSLFLFTCQTKNFEFEFVDSKCRNFKIDYGRIQSVIDPSCPADAIMTGSAKITFDFNGEADCIKSLNVSALFFNDASNTITGVSYEQLVDKANITIDAAKKTVEFTFTYTFSSVADADLMNYLIVDVATVNESGKESNKIKVRYNSACFTPDPSTYTDKGSINTVPGNTYIYLYDHAADDGDLVSVYLNNTLVVQSYRITNTEQPFSINISNGDNLIIYAMNQGSSGPNTVGFKINGIDTQINLETNQGFKYTLN